MAAVFAGFVVGFALSLIIAPAAAIALVRSNNRTGFAQRVAPPGTNVVALTMVIHFGALLLLTAAGMILGLMLYGLEQRRPDGGLGSPNLAFTLTVFAFTAAIVIPTLIVPAIRAYTTAAALVLLASFGWAMPWLATLGD